MNSVKLELKQFLLIGTQYSIAIFRFRRLREKLNQHNQHDLRQLAQRAACPSNIQANLRNSPGASIGTATETADGMPRHGLDRSSRGGAQDHKSNGM